MKEKPGSPCRIGTGVAPMSKPRSNPMILRTSLLMPLLAACLFLSSCTYYKIVGVFEPEARTFPAVQASKVYFLHDSVQTWYVKGLAVNNDSIYGEFIKIYNYRQQAEMKKINRRYTRDQSFVLNEIHLYAKDHLLSLQGMGSLPFTAIRYAQFYKDDPSLSALASISAFLLIFPGVFLETMLVLASVSGSCPFIYSFDGNDFQFSGEIYAGALYQPLERHDYLILDQLKPVDRHYRIQMRNELHEVEQTNLTELMIVDHPSNLTVMADKYGQFQTLANPVKPVRATSLAGDDILNLVSGKDNLTYHGEISPDKIGINQSVILDFPRANTCKSAKLIIRAKNSLWLEYVYTELQKKSGFLYPVWSKKHENRDPGLMQKWSLDQNIPLSVYVERNGNWEFSDYYNVAGPMAMKDDVLSIDLTGTGDGPVRVKLVTGNQFWEIDYAGLELSENVALTVQRVLPSSAIDKDGRDVLASLTGDDDDYYVQPEIGDQVELVFDVPENAGKARTVVLHSKGWYHKLVESKQIPEITKIKSFRDPDQLARYSNELIMKVLANSQN